MKFLKATASVLCFVVVACLVWAAWQLYTEIRALTSLIYPLLGICLFTLLGYTTWPKDERKRQDEERKAISELKAEVQQICLQLQLIVLRHPAGVNTKGSRISDWTETFIAEIYAKGTFRTEIVSAAAAMQEADAFIESLSRVGGPKGSWQRRKVLRSAKHHVDRAKPLLAPVLRMIALIPHQFLK